MNNVEQARPGAVSALEVNMPAQPNEAADRDFVTALARGLDVLRCFSRNAAALGPTEVAQMSGLPKSTVTRLIHTLSKLDYLRYLEGSGKYQLGPAMMSLNTAPREQLDVRAIARPLLQELAGSTGAQVALVTRDQLSVLYLETFRGQSLVTLNLNVGSRIPLAVTAGGRACLAGMPPGERASVLERIRSVDEYAWQAIAPGVDAAMKEFAETGCCSSMGDWVPQIHGIAAPLATGSGMPPMAISIAGVADMYPADRMLAQMRPKLLDVVHAIQARAGCAN